RIRAASQRRVRMGRLLFGGGHWVRLSLERSRRETLQRGGILGSDRGRTWVGRSSDPSPIIFRSVSDVPPIRARSGSDKGQGADPVRPQVAPPSVVLKVRPSAVVTVADCASVARMAITSTASGNATRRQERPSAVTSTVPPDPTSQQTDGIGDD